MTNKIFYIYKEPHNAPSSANLRYHYCILQNKNNKITKHIEVPKGESKVTTGALLQNKTIKYRSFKRL